MLAKHILSLLFLCCGSSLFAQCVSQWSVPSSSDALVLREEGIEKQLSLGGSRAYTNRPLPSGGKGTTNFKLLSFGTDGVKPGSITFGVEVDNKEYAFILSNSNAIVLNKDGSYGVAYREKEAIKVGDDIKLERYDAGIGLLVNDVFVANIDIPGSTNKTNIFVELEKLDAKLSKPSLDFGCGIEVLEPGCDGTWNIVGNSTLVSLDGGKGLWKTQRTNSKANLRDVLPKNTNGDVRFQVTNWGTFAEDKSSIIQFGAKVKGVKYSFLVGSNGMIIPQIDDAVQKVVDIGKLINENPLGPQLKLDRTDDKLSLSINEVVVSTLSGLAVGKTKFWVKLKKKDMEIASTEQSFSCGATGSCVSVWELARPDISLLEVQNGGSGLLRSPSLKKKANLDERLASGQEGSVLFRITDFGNLGTDKTSTLDFGIKVNGVKHHFAIGSNGMIVPVSDGAIQKVVEIGKLINADPYGPVIKLTRTDQNLKLYINGVLTSTIDAVGVGETQFWTKLKGPNLQLSYTVQTFGDCKEFTAYTALERSLNSQAVELKDETLRIKYLQEYAITTNTAQTAYAIYDWQRNETTGGFVTEFGVNWVDIDVSGLNPSTYYVLELEGNKGKQYFLRFKTAD